MEQVKFVSISELSKKLDIPAHTLRYWEKEFPSLIQPTTGAGGRRFYRPETVENIEALKRHLYSEGRTLDGVRKLIANGEFNNDKKSTPVAQLTTPPTPDIDHAKKDTERSAQIAEAISLLKEAKELLKE